MGLQGQGMNQKAQSIHINFDASGGFTLQPNENSVDEGLNISTASAGKGNNIIKYLLIVFSSSSDRS